MPFWPSLYFFKRLILKKPTSGTDNASSNPAIFFDRCDPFYFSIYKTLFKVVSRAVRLTQLAAKGAARTSKRQRPAPPFAVGTAIASALVSPLRYNCAQCLYERKLYL